MPCDEDVTQLLDLVFECECIRSLSAGSNVEQAATQLPTAGRTWNCYGDRAGGIVF